MQILDRAQALAVKLKADPTSPFDLFKDLIWDTTLEALVAAASGILPGWLSWLGPLVGSILITFADKLYYALKLVVDMENVRIKNAELRREFAAASVELRYLIDSQGIDSEAFKHARVEHKKALSKFVQWNPTPAG